MRSSLRHLTAAPTEVAKFRAARGDEDEAAFQRMHDAMFESMTRGDVMFERQVQRVRRG